MQHRAGLTATKPTSAAAKATINAALRAQPGPLTRLADRDATTEAHTLRTCMLCESAV
jgi:hypothetical protein